MQKRSNIEQFYTYLNTVLTTLLENKIKTRAFITGAQQYKNEVLDNNLILLSDEIRQDQQALSKSNEQLIKLRTINWERSIHQIKNLLVKCDYLVRDLHKALIGR
ncbi:MAG: hypothetical protein L3J59_08570 [Methylococcaceae bacterium]|nr:hypothetical protein [Methylococcaceae bacterium]